MKGLESYFETFRQGIIGLNQTIATPYGVKKIVYADWTASGRMYQPIEERLMNEVYPYVANTHTEATSTGKLMTRKYHDALVHIKKHVNAGPDDVIICHGSGMTSVINKFQRILGLRIHEKFRDRIQLTDQERPVVFVTHMEHHSNHTSWLETIADVCIIPATSEGLVDTVAFEDMLQEMKHRPYKIAAITSCSNVTGVFTPYHELAAIIHRHGGYCFVDFACSAPYIQMDMHPATPGEHLDAIYFSPHKFLGGPGSPGVLVFNKKLYQNRIPDCPGGGTVVFTNPWGGHDYIGDIEAREDGGTPGFLQAIRASMAIELKERMGVLQIRTREHEITDTVFARLEKIPGLHILAGNIKDRLPVISFYIDGLHYNLGVQLFNDRFGIQTRGGCSCAGTYGHYLLELSKEKSALIETEILHGNLSVRPGWIRLSLHPTMTDADIHYCLNSVEDIAQNWKKYAVDYRYNVQSNEFDWIPGEPVNLT